MARLTWDGEEIAPRTRIVYEEDGERYMTAMCNANLLKFKERVEKGEVELLCEKAFVLGEDFTTEEITCSKSG